MQTQMNQQNQNLMLNHKPTLYMCVGLPDSGKSTYSQQLKHDIEIQGGTCDILSSDDIRERVFGDVNNQDHQKVFEILHTEMVAMLKLGHDVIYDATNLNARRRKYALSLTNGMDIERVCLLFVVPYEVCLQRDKVRDRHVGEAVLNKMLRSFQTPSYVEGFDDILIVPYKEYETNESLSYWTAIIYYKNFNQHSKWHDYTLGEHMNKTGQYIFDKFFDTKNHSLNHNQQRLFLSALYHDCGKPYCQSFIDKDGNAITSATYHGHDCASAYEMLNICLFNKVNDDSYFNHFSYEDMLYMSKLVCFHMKAFRYNENPKLLEKDKQIHGEQFIRDVMILHEADMASCQKNISEETVGSDSK